MNKKIARFLLLFLIMGMWVTNTGCKYDGDATLTVTNTGPATVIIFFLQATTKLESGKTEIYTITLPGNQSAAQTLSWYPLIHPNRTFFEEFILEDDVTTHVDIYYDPQNPPPE